MKPAAFFYVGYKLDTDQDPGKRGGAKGLHLWGKSSRMSFFVLQSAEFETRFLSSAV